MRKSLIISLIICFTILVNAQTPHLFNFQFMARDASDNLIVNQDISVRIRILSEHSSGPIVYSETHQTTTNAFGQGTLTIGSGVPDSPGSLSSVNWGSNQYFVQMSIDPSGGSAFQIYGTSQLLSVPYALYAETSGNTSAWQTSGNTGNTATNFIGNIDNTPLNFRVNNMTAGRITSSGQQFFGFQAGENNTATTSTAMGYRALRMNTSGARNTAMGFEALRDNSTGNDNIAFGTMALQTNTTGFENLAIGTDALRFNDTGNRNSALGVGTLYGNSTGSGNIALGYTSLHNNSTGSDNNAVGTFSLRLNSTGSNNVAIGSGSLYFNTIGSYNTATGGLAMYGNVSGIYNSAFGYNALNASASGSYNTALGHDALSLSTTGSNNIGIGFQANVPSATGNNQVRIGNSSISYAGVEVPWTTTSDRRVKTNIHTSPLGLDFIMKLHPVVYSRGSDSSETPEYGFIAQEVETALVASGISISKGLVSIDDMGFYGLRYTDFIAPLVKSIQEQQKIIEDQRLVIIELLKQHADIINRLEKAEAKTRKP